MIALTTAHLVNEGTDCAHLNDRIVRLELKLKKLETRNKGQIAQFTDVVRTCHGLGMERKVLERMVKERKEDGSGSQTQGEGQGEEGAREKAAADLE